MPRSPHYYGSAIGANIPPASLRLINEPADIEKVVVKDKGKIKQICLMLLNRKVDTIEDIKVLALTPNDPRTETTRVH